MTNLKITNQAEKFLLDLQPKQLKQVMSTVLRLLRDPYPHDSCNLKGAKKGERRVDIGEYRVIYIADAEMVYVLVIGQRNDDDAYKIWERNT